MRNKLRMSPKETMDMYGIRARYFNSSDLPKPDFGLVDSDHPDIWAMIGEEILAGIGSMPETLDDVDDEVILHFSLSRDEKEKILDMLCNQHIKEDWCGRNVYNPRLRKVQIGDRKAYRSIEPQEAFVIADASVVPAEMEREEMDDDLVAVDAEEFRDHFLSRVSKLCGDDKAKFNRLGMFGSTAFHQATNIPHFKGCIAMALRSVSHQVLCDENKESIEEMTEEEYEVLKTLLGKPVSQDVFAKFETPDA